MKHGPRKIITCVLVFLLLGAIVNVAVALSLAKWGAVPSITFQDLGEQVVPKSSETALWKQHAPSEWSEPPSHGFLHVVTGKQYLQMLRIENSFEAIGLSQDDFIAKSQAQRAFVLWILDCGWPRHCVGAQSWYETVGLQRNSVQYSGQLFGRVQLPSRLIWPGFAINTIFYAATLWMLWFTPFALRRRRRIKRGLCPACAYPTRGGTSPVCTECGKPVARE